MYYPSVIICISCLLTPSIHPHKRTAANANEWGEKMKWETDRKKATRHRCIVRVTVNRLRSADAYGFLLRLSTILGIYWIHRHHKTLIRYYRIYLLKKAKTKESERRKNEYGNSIIGDRIRTFHFIFILFFFLSLPIEVEVSHFDELSMLTMSTSIRICGYVREKHDNFSCYRLAHHLLWR